MLLVSALGGWDISYALDPKPGLPTVDVPEGDVQLFDDLPIFVHPSRPNVTAFFESYGDRTAVVNGIGMRSISHITCGQRIFTGHSATVAPDLGAIVGHELGRELPMPYLVLGDAAFSGTLGVSTGRIGSINQINALLPPGEFLPEAPEFASDRYVATSEDEALIQQYLDARAQREQATRGARGYNRMRVDDYRESLLKAEAVRSRSGAFGEFAFSYELQQQADFAVQALAEDLSFSVSLDSRLDWDTHGFNEIQGTYHEVLFEALSYLAGLLDGVPGSSGSTLLDETIVVVISEMSRTPLLNAAGGKDHWPTTSMLMFGGPVRGGRAYGMSNDLVEAEMIDLQTAEVDRDGAMLEPKHALAGLAEAAGVLPETFFPDTEVFRAPFV
ncbi:MAG: DUF1501 domain-containing protein [Myxococcota bacterium]